MVFTKLTAEQQKAYDAIKAGHSVFLTGNAGTGKSYVLQKVMQYFHKHKMAFVASAPTGIAALNINGVTLHSLLHIRPGIITDGPNYLTINQWRKMFKDGGILIVDEISMCRLDLFELLVKTIKETEDKTKEPIQVIFVGDFYQLPPIVAANEQQEYFKHFKGTYAFESPLWQDLNLDNMILHEEIRQQQTTDREKWFVQALNHIRFNDHYALNAIQYINQECYHASLDPKGIFLCGYRRSVDQINSNHLKDLSGKEVDFHCYSDKTITPGTYPVNQILHLKIGARVMCVKNTKDDNNETIYNGQQGTVIDIMAHGKRLSKSKTNLSANAPGKSVYSAYSHGNHEPLKKCQEDNGVLVEFDAMNNSPKTRSWISWDFWQKSRYVIDGGQLKQETIGYFGQIPLKLAYAITIHKAQGQTIQGSMNLKSEIFAPGQLYVGLSRVKSIDNLHLQSPLRPQDAIPNLKVTEFYRSIDPAMQNMQVHYDRNKLLAQLGQIVQQMPDNKLAQFINLANMYK